MLKSLLRTVAARLRRDEAGPEPSVAAAAAALGSGDLQRATLLAEAAVKRDPDRHEAWNLLGAIALREGEDDKGVRCFDRAAALAEGSPDHSADYLANSGEACRRAGQYERAVERLQAALGLAPGHAGALYGLAMSFGQQWRADEAFDVYQRMLAAQPDFCRGHQGYLFFLNLYRAQDPEFVLAEHLRWASLHADAAAPSAAPRSHPPGPKNRITVGYVSADFNRHAVGYFIEPILRHHDRGRFRIVLYSNALREDGSTARFVALADAWRDITPYTDAGAAALMRRDGVDVLVDLSGHTAGNRLLAFAHRPSPVQMTYLGYPSGTGMAAMDYRITDPVADVQGQAQQRYRERLLFMPDSLWCYRPPEFVPEAGETGASRRFTFGSLNHVLKITPRLVALWARILRDLPEARLVMAAIPAGEAQSRIAAEFSRHGVDPGRVQILGRLEQTSFWAIHRGIDIALDSYPCHGGTTTCETLWLGVPVVTLVGDAFVSRVGLSLLSALGLQELAARCEDDFVTLAVGLARDPGRLAALRGSLRQRMRRSALMDGARFAGGLEALYLDAWRARPDASGA